jgi:hypothetical protein
MNHLASYSDFSKGVSKPLEFKLPKSGSKSIALESSPKIEEVEKNEEMSAFAEAYEAVEAEYTKILREIHRVENKSPKLKKDISDLKKNFGDLMSKLQFFAEYSGGKEIVETNESDK